MCFILFFANIRVANIFLCFLLALLPDSRLMSFHISSAFLSGDNWHQNGSSRDYQSYKLQSHSLLPGVQRCLVLHPSSTFGKSQHSKKQPIITHCYKSIKNIILLLLPLFHLCDIINPDPCPFCLCVSKTNPESALPDVAATSHIFNAVTHKFLCKHTKTFS